MREAVPGRRACTCHEDHEAKEQIKQKNLRGSIENRPALEQQKQNHLQPCSRRLTTEEEKQTGAQTGVKQEQQIFLHTLAARFLISRAGNEVLTSRPGARKDFAAAQTNWHRSRNLSV
jgi:FtsZ-interacting cell division protein ZipA